MLRRSARRFVPAVFSRFSAVCLSLALGVATLAACSGESGYGPGTASHESIGEGSEALVHKPPVQMCPDFVRTCAPSEVPVCNPCCNCERAALEP